MTSRRFRTVTLGASWLYLAPVPAAAQDLVVLYPSYGSGTAAVIEGRVIEAKSHAAWAENDRRRDNLLRNIDLWLNDERPTYPVRVRVADREWKTLTDAEGYFRIEVEDLALPAGRHAIGAEAGDGSAASDLWMVPPANVHGLISDVDDTIQVTGVNRKRSLLANTLLKNPLQREAVPGVTAFYRELLAVNVDPASVPAFYLSASPRQIHGSLAAFLERHAFPPGVLITKRVADDSTREPLRDQVAYKTAKIEEIFARLPHMSFTLVGDDGEKDPEIFAVIRERHPARVEAVWIRHVNPDPARARFSAQGRLDERLERYLTDAPAP